MKKKGFTLVELLAVIVIIAIIAVIATPIILNVIESAKEKAALEGFRGYLDAAEKAIILNDLKPDKNFPKAAENGCYSLSKDSGLNTYIKIKGTAPTFEEGAAKICFTKGNVTSATGLIVDGYKTEYKDGKYSINGKVIEKEEEKEEEPIEPEETFTGITSGEHTVGSTLTYLGKNWKVMKDNGESTQLVLDGYLSADELKNNLPDGVETSQLSSNKMRLCLHKNYGKSISDYSTVRDAFVASAGSYCYNIWNGDGNEYRAYTWNTSIVKPTIENWLNSKMTEQGLTKDKELVTMTFNDGVSNLTGYVRIPTYDDVEAVGSYNTIDNTNYMYTEYDYLIMTANGTNTNQSKVYNYYGSSTVAGVTLGNSAFQGRVRPIITVRER